MSFLACGVLDKVQFIYFFPWTACTFGVTVMKC